MIEITSVDQLKEGDTILIEGMEDSEVLVVEVESIDGNLIIPKGLGGLDYCPEDPESIIRIGRKKEEPTVTPISQKLHFKLTKEWQQIFNQQ